MRRLSRDINLLPFYSTWCTDLRAGVHYLALILESPWLARPCYYDKAQLGECQNGGFVLRRQLWGRKLRLVRFPLPELEQRWVLAWRVSWSCLTLPEVTTLFLGCQHRPSPGSLACGLLLTNRSEEQRTRGNGDASHKKVSGLLEK